MLPSILDIVNDVIVILDYLGHSGVTRFCCEMVAKLDIRFRGDGALTAYFRAGISSRHQVYPTLLE